MAVVESYQAVRIDTDRNGDGGGDDDNGSDSIWDYVFGFFGTVPDGVETVFWMLFCIFALLLIRSFLGLIICDFSPWIVNFSRILKNRYHHARKKQTKKI